jgi:hypothetical protein
MKFWISKEFASWRLSRGLSVRKRKKKK